MPRILPVVLDAGLAAVLAAAVLSGCAEDGVDPSAGKAPDSAPTASGSASSRAEAPRLPATPSSDPATLTRQIARSERTIRDPHARARDVRRAGELQQLAARELAAAPAAVRRTVLAGLSPRDRTVTRLNAQAAQELLSLTEPQRHWPKDWRIVAPHPPEELLADYHRAERLTGVPWEYLAAINLVETRMGRIHGTSTAGAQGPMQFLPSTWRVYGGGGDIDDPRDAILGAARLLKANGAPGDIRGALWHYNASQHYVDAVTAHAAVLRRSPATYRGYWHWRVLYRHVSGVHVMPVGYPKVRPQPLD